MSKPVDLGSVKTGSYILIDGEPCKIVQYDKSKPGKHGSAKARVVGVGLFDDVKRSIVSPVSATVEVPLIEKKNGQVLSISSDSIQIMDLESYEIFEAKKPEDEMMSKINDGTEIEYWSVLGRNKLSRIKN
jgi:translation initiation factor 5A|tara:strand:+ start:153 stop:545 length:393 start_codon:yes stop_codon:yes gene_type:complete